MMLALLRKKFEQRSGHLGRAAIALLGGCCLSGALACEVYAGGVPLPRGMKPGKVPTATAGASPTSTALSPALPPATDATTSAVDKLNRYARRDQELRQRLSTATQAPYKIAVDTQPPSGAAVMVEDAPAQDPLPPAISAAPAALVTDHARPLEKANRVAEPVSRALEVVPPAAAPMRVPQTVAPTAQRIAPLVEEPRAPRREIAPANFAVPQGNFGLSESEPPRSAPAAMPALSATPSIAAEEKPVTSVPPARRLPWPLDGAAERPATQVPADAVFQPALVAESISPPALQETEVPRAVAFSTEPASMIPLAEAANDAVVSPIEHVAVIEADQPLLEPTHAPGLEPATAPLQETVSEPTFEVAPTNNRARSAADRVPGARVQGPFQIIDQSGEF
ncbi:MAG: hypothetical protein KF708_23370, partial [Pirellulales bacterium]|nr:hypothetical protein [Pirellulales bacterium]